MTSLCLAKCHLQVSVLFCLILQSLVTVGSFLNEPRFLMPLYQYTLFSLPGRPYTFHFLVNLHTHWAFSPTSSCRVCFCTLTVPSVYLHFNLNSLILPLSVLVFSTYCTKNSLRAGRPVLFLFVFPVL